MCISIVKMNTFLFMTILLHILHTKVLSGFLQVLVTLSGPSAYTNPLLQSSKCKNLNLRILNLILLNF